MIQRISKRSTLLFIFDIGAVLLAFLCGVYVRSSVWDLEVLLQPFVLLSVPIFLILFYVFDLYYPFKKFRLGPTFVDVVFSVLIGSLVLAAASYLDRTLLVQRPVFILSEIFLVFFACLTRFLYSSLLKIR